jgi:hypothetical protein
MAATMDAMDYAVKLKRYSIRSEEKEYIVECK